MTTAHYNFPTPDRQAHTFFWKLGKDSVGDPLTNGPKTLTVQVQGSFGESLMFLEGSNDDTNWFTLSDPQGLPLRFNSPGLKPILGQVAQIRPRVQGGDDETALTIAIFVKE